MRKNNSIYKTLFRFYRNRIWSPHSTATGENDIYTISGLDSSQQPLSIAWEVAGGDTDVDISGGLVGVKSGTKETNDGLVCQKVDPCMPVVIAAYSSHLEVTAGRNVQLGPVIEPSVIFP